MTSTWSHYNKRDTHTHKQVRTTKSREQRSFRTLRRAAAASGGAAAHLRRRPVLLHRRREGAGVGVGGWRFHIVVAEAAEERAEDASAPLLLQAAVGLGHCQNRRRERERAAGERAAMQITCAVIKTKENGSGGHLHFAVCMWNSGRGTTRSSYVASGSKGQTFGVLKGHQRGLC